MNRTHQPIRVETGPLLNVFETEFWPFCFQTYSRAHAEPPSDYHADNSRSDLSDILEEEEEDLYSDHLSEKQRRGYTVGANRVKKRSCSF